MLRWPFVSRTRGFGQTVGAQARLAVVVIRTHQSPTPVAAVDDRSDLTQLAQPGDAHVVTYRTDGVKRRPRDAYNVAVLTATVEKQRLVLGLAGAFAGMTALVLVMSLAFAQPALLVVALPMGVATYVFWYQASGKLKRRVKRTRASAGVRGTNAGRGGFGAGPRPPPSGARSRQAWEAWERRQREWRRQRQRAASTPTSGLSADEAYRRLGLDADADETAVKRAYRERVKDVHPDRGGSEKEFKRVTEAYEALSSE